MSGSSDTKTGDTDQMEDERQVRFDEKYIPAWVVAEAVGKAIDEDVRGVESRGGQTFAVLVDRSEDTGGER